MNQRIQRGSGALFLALCAQLVGCGDAAPAVGTNSRLVGTWQLDVTLDPKFAAFAQRHGIEPRQSFPTTDAAELPLRFTFTSGGEYVMEGSMLGHQIREVCRWTVVEDSGDSVRIELHEAQKPAESMTYVFTAPDVIRADTKAGPMFLRRVK